MSEESMSYQDSPQYDRVHTVQTGASAATPTTSRPPQMVVSTSRPEPAKTDVSSGAVAADRARAMLSQPERAATILWAVGVLAVASVIPMRHWPRPALLALLIAVGIVGIGGGLRAIGSRLARWSLHIDVGIGTLLVTAVSAAGNSENVHLANLYLLITLYAVLYLPLRVALAHIVAAGAAYAALLAVGPRPDDILILAWMEVFGTALAIGAVAYGLVSMLRLASMQDPLTGLANRRSCDERLDEELQRSRRTGAALSVALIDLDGFKAVNDRDGHDAGDRLLQNLAHSWQDAVRSGGTS